MRPMNSKAREVEHLVAKFANERRLQRGLDRLDSDRALTAAAREHSRDMARRWYFDHESKRYGEPTDRVKKYDSVSENISKEINWNQSPGSIAGDAIEGWMKSPGHRHNILESNHTRQGVGVWKNGDEVYLTHMFLPKWASVESSHRGSQDDPIGRWIESAKRYLKP